MPEAPGSGHRRINPRRSTPGNLTYYRDNDFANANEPVSGNTDQSSPPSTPSRQQHELIFNNQPSALPSSSTDHSEKDSNPNPNSLFDSEVVACPYGCCKNESTSEYIFKRGFLEGAYSDVTIKAFGSSYKLHRLFLDKSDYFKFLFKWSKNEAPNKADEGNDVSTEDRYDAENQEDDEYLGKSEGKSTGSSAYEKHIENEHKNVFELEFDDSRIIQSSFELAIARLYGAINIKEENKIPYNMIAVGQYLALGSVVCTATDYIVKNMTMDNLSENMKFAASNNYGSASERIIQNGKGILCSDGWEVGVHKWDDIPVSIIAEVIGENYFFVPTEWDRCLFIIKLIERKLESSIEEDEMTCEDQVKVLKQVLNEKIHYCHLSPEQLQELESYIDINGTPYIDPQVLHKALWQAVQLNRLVVNSGSTLNLANVITAPRPPTNDSKWFQVPIKDVTLTGLPTEIDKLMLETLSSTAQSVSLENGKSTQDETPSKSERTYSWTKFPPFRFSISFANVSDLSTDKRVYGKTFWYAGSYWNLYLQKNHIHSKNTFQIGVYLHRANNSSNPSSKHGSTNPDLYANNLNYQSLPKKYSQTSTLTISKEISQGSNLQEAEEKANIQEDASFLGLNELSLNDGNDGRPLSGLGLGSPVSRNTVNMTNATEDKSLLTYEDQRNAIRVYFIIFTPSRREKPTITSFLSIPNDFHKSQSWGWKSNSMCVFNDDGTFPAGHDPHLKFMIVLGNV